MRIGIDIQATQTPQTGLGVYTENLYRYLVNGPSKRHQFFLYSQPVQQPWHTPRRLWWENVELPKCAARDKVELLHVPAFAPPFCKPCRLVITVHDLIGMIFPNQIGLPSRLYWGKWLPFVIRRADAIIVDSENTKKDVLKFLGVSEKRLRVIYLSGHETFSSNLNGKPLQQLKNRLGIKEKYFLCVSAIEPRKNLSRVIKAFIQFVKQKQNARYQLVVVGSKTFAYGRTFQELVAETALQFKDVIFTGYIQHEDLNLLYCGTEAFLFPSLYEGFGIPVLEAMASGAPVMTSHVSSLPEVAGEAAYYVDPYDVCQITEGMHRLAEETQLRQDLIQRGFKQIQKFSWKRTGEQTIEVYEAVA